MSVKLGKICTFQSGGTPTKSNSEYFNGNIPWITTTALSGKRIDSCDAVDWITEKAIKETAAKIVPANSIMVGTRVGVGKVAVNAVDMSTSQDIISLLNIDESTWSKDYICKYIEGKSHYLNSQARGATIKGIKIDVLANLDLPELSLDQQRNIATIVNIVKSIIDLRKSELSTLDELIKARFVEMFGMPLDRAKANMKFTDCVDFNPKKSEVKDLQDVEVSFVPMECVGVDGSFTIRENGLVSSYYKGYTYFRDGDVLLAKITPCFENGKAAIAEGCKNGIGFGTTEFHVARPKEGVSNSYWIKYMLKNDSVHDLATINMTGSAGQKRIQTPFFEKLTIFCPPIELQNQFADFVKQVDKSKVAVQKSLDETQKLFDSLMQEYFG